MLVSKGFTLIELMIVVAIVAILAAVAVPSYKKFVLEGRRAEGKAFALDIASRQERHWTQYSAYATNANFVANLGLPNGANSENNTYTASMPASGDTFQVRVTPTFTDTDCGWLQLDNVGRRTNQTNDVECWR